MAWLRKAAAAFGGSLFLLMFLVFVLQVAARLLFGHPLPWSDEAAVVLYVWIILWAGAFMVPEREHVVFDLLWNHAGPRLRRAMRIAGNLLLGGLALAGLPATWDYVHFMGRESTPVLGISFEWVFLPFVLLLAGIAARSARALWQMFSDRPRAAPHIHHSSAP